MMTSKLTPSGSRFSTFRFWSSRFLTGVSGPRGRTGFAGLLAGFYLLACCHHFLAVFGAALSSVTAMAVAIAVGVEFGNRPVRRSVAGMSVGQLRGIFTKDYAIWHAFLAVWCLLLPWFFDAVLAVMGRIPAEVMAAPGRALLFQLLAALVLLSVPLFGLTRLPILLSAIFSQDAGDVRKVVVRERGFVWRAASWLFRFSRLSRLFSPFEASRLQDVFGRYLLGLVGALLLGTLVIAPWGSLRVMVAMACCGSFCVSGLIAFRLWNAHFQMPELVDALQTGDSQTGDSQKSDSYKKKRSKKVPRKTVAKTVEGDAISPRQLPLLNGWHCLFAVGLGGLLAIVLRMVGQLSVAGGYLVFTEWAVLLGGLAWGLSRRGGLSGSETFQKQSSRGEPVRSFRPALFGLLIAGWGAVVLCSYGLLTRLSLMVSWAVYQLLAGVDAVVSYCVLEMQGTFSDEFLVWFSLMVSRVISESWLTMLCHCGLVMLVLFPLGFGWGRLVGSSSFIGSSKNTGGDRAGNRLPNLQLFALVTGYLVVHWVGFVRWDVADLLCGFSWGLAGLSGCHLVMSSWGTETKAKTTKPVGKLRAVPVTTLVVALVAALIAVPFLRSEYDSGKTARQLFATNVTRAYLQGTDSSKLSFLDEGRLIFSQEGAHGTLTVWRLRGNQLQIRENGIPKAIVSTRPQYCPHFSAEMMPAVMPLVLHEQPRRVMILGIGGGVPLTTSLRFPVEHVTCVEGNQQLTELLENVVWKESGEIPFEDRRLHYLPIDPTLAVACKSGAYDVVISNPDHSALLHSSAYFTQEFYQGVSRQLSDDGIFCQRFQQIDYGPMPLQSIVKTLQAVFQNVVAIQIANGETALLATNSAKGLSRAGLLERFQAENVRGALSELGWDWSVPLNLIAYSHDGLKEFAASSSIAINTAGNGRLAYRLPQEMLRWGPKMAEFQKSIAAYGSRFAESHQVNSSRPEFLRRLREMVSERRLKVMYPDKWWTYRTKLKDQIRNRPRTQIQKVGYATKAGGLHPEDRRRMYYLDALDRAKKEPTLRNIQRVSNYIAPYDPTFSYFLHHEVAELYLNAPERDFQDELRHRLHAVYFADSQDRSIRCITAAIQLLTEHREAAESPMACWDHLNALLQLVRSRWKLRGMGKPSSVQIAINDVDHSLGAIKSALTTMNSLRESADVSESDWKTRRAILEQGMVGPLRAYRAVLVKYHLEQRYKLDQLLNEELPDEESADDEKTPEELLEFLKKQKAAQQEAAKQKTGKQEEKKGND